MADNSLDTKLINIEKALGGSESMPASTEDKLGWHLDYIESLIGSAPSGGTKLYRHTISLTPLSGGLNPHTLIMISNQNKNISELSSNELFEFKSFFASKNFSNCYLHLTYTGSVYVLVGFKSIDSVNKTVLDERNQAISITVINEVFYSKDDYSFTDTVTEL